jgi:tetratricopeptide (TPR) repeat protein
MRTPETEAKPKFLDQFASFLGKYRLVLLVILIALLVFVVGYFGYTEWHKGARERSALMAERAQDLFQEWQNEKDETNRKAKEQELRELVDRIVAKYPRQYAAQRALYLKATLAYEKRLWQESAEAYESLVKSFPRSYLAEISLVAAAVCYEQAGDPQAAIGAYKRFSERHGESFLLPHALFSLGRLYELAEDFPAAVQTYNSLDEKFPFSNWTKAGRNRIIALKVQGKIAE